ncbi:MAG: hypothetical protein KME06_00525 [Kastovskya adunca ATA6-11-RM4]|jgi:hypothetical protein|nr:hypothetical protein [Kastovskya adunca ATA6-11-RM4]
MLNQNQTYSAPHWSKRTGACLGAFTLALTTLLVGCGGGEEIEEGRTNVTKEDVADVAADPTSPVVGKEVTIRSETATAVGENSFVLQPEGGESILVVNSTGDSFVLPSEIPIQATGTVEEFVVADVEEKYGLTLEDELYVDYERKPAIIAKSLALAPKPEQLAQAPAGYFDKKIAVEGDLRKLEATNNAFALFEEGWVDDVGVLVVGTEGKTGGGVLDEGENVTVTGVARQANAQVLQEANLGWDDNKIQEFLSRYTDRPVIVADGVYPSAVDPAPGN